MITARRGRCNSLGMFGLLQIGKGRCMAFGLRSMVLDGGDLARVLDCTEVANGKCLI